MMESSHLTAVGDCRELLRRLPENTFTACVTDPPYHLTQLSRGGPPRGEGTGPFGRHTLGERGFMGKTWDGGDVAFQPETWAEVLRVMRPGAYLLAFGGDRTYCQMGEAIRQSGFVQVNTLVWCYASGMPKYRYSLKPAVELIYFGRKPMDGTYEHNHAKWKCGLLNVDDCRISSDDDKDRSRPASIPNAILGGGKGTNLTPSEHNELGRWPTNLIHDGSDEVTALFPASNNGSKGTRDGEESADRSYKDDGSTNFAMKPGERRNDKGSAARFFYCAKASRKERGEGNDHPTVKPLALMEYLVNLVKQPELNLVLDPFCGSGTTLLAALRNGVACVGLDSDPHAIEITESRLKTLLAETP
jgi:site-specific DNA-methyltransferase (adenine-specific)